MTEKKKPKFLRRKSFAYSKLGKGRKKKQVWRRPSGRDNKMREKRKGYPVVVSVGYKSDKISRGTLREKQPTIVMNIKDLDKIKESGIAIIGKIGKKKKLEIAKAAKEKKIEIYNMNAKKYLKKNTPKPKDKKTENKKDSKTKSEIKENKK